MYVYAVEFRISGVYEYVTLKDLYHRRRTSELYVIYTKNRQAKGAFYATYI